MIVCMYVCMHVDANCTWVLLDRDTIAIIEIICQKVYLIVTTVVRLHLSCNFMLVVLYHNPRAHLPKEA